MPIGAAIGSTVVGVGGSILSANAQKDASKAAVGAQEQSSAQQLQLLHDIYSQNTANELPYMNAGYGALAAQQQLLGLKPLSADQFNSGNWYAPGTVNYNTGSGSTGNGFSGAATPPVTGPAAPGYAGPSLAEIQAMQHDGIPGNYKAALNAYNSYQSSHPATPTTPAANPALLQIQAQQAIAAGANPAQVQAHMATLTGGFGQ